MRWGGENSYRDCNEQTCNISTTKTSAVTRRDDGLTVGKPQNSDFSPEYGAHLGIL